MGIHLVRSLVTRGVLLDVARAKGVDILEAGYAIHPGTSTPPAPWARRRVRPGDVVLVRTGQVAHLALPGRPGGAGADPCATRGVHLATPACPWRRPSGSTTTRAAVATDTLALEVYPCETPDLYLPVHLLHLVEMGMTQGQNWVLDELAADCADDGVYSSARRHALPVHQRARLAGQSRRRALRALRALAVRRGR